MELTKVNNRTLHCEIGNHDWLAPIQRGRPPKNCPDHKPVVVYQAKPKNPEANVRRTIEATLAEPRSQGCECGITADFSRDDLTALGGGCKMPAFCCSVLDTIRRKIGPRPEEE